MYSRIISYLLYYIHTFEEDPDYELADALLSFYILQVSSFRAARYFSSFSRLTVCCDVQSSQKIISNLTNTIPSFFLLRLFFFFTFYTIMFKRFLLFSRSSS